MAGEGYGIIVEEASAKLLIHNDSLLQQGASEKMQAQFSAEDVREAHAVIIALRGYRDEIDRIMGQLEGKQFLTQDGKRDLQELLRSFKERLKQSAKIGTVSGESWTQNKFESAYFSRAVFQASANLRVAVNSHPIQSNWFSALYGIRVDITHPLFQLESQFPTSEAT